jgi:hypothetical protein
MEIVSTTVNLETGARLLAQQGRYRIDFPQAMGHLVARQSPTGEIHFAELFLPEDPPGPAGTVLRLGVRRDPKGRMSTADSRCWSAWAPAEVGERTPPGLSEFSTSVGQV